MSDYSKAMPTKDKKSKKKGGIAFICWALGFLVIVIIFLVKLDDIKANLKQTNFFERLFHTTPTFIQNYEEKKPNVQEDVLAEETYVASDAQQTPITPISSLIDDEPLTPASPLPPTAEALSNALQGQDAADAADAPSMPPSPVQAEEAQERTQGASSDQVQQSAAHTQFDGTDVQRQTSIPVQQTVETTTARLCFVTIDGDGVVSRREITRTIKKNDSPLTENIKQLIAGPTQLERNKGCRSLIPDGTRLLSASVRNGTAQLSFSEEFEYNQTFGVEGYLGQLMQIVYTATEFSTVTSVQILIDGQKKEYLGSEGVWIGSPLSRTSFK